MENQLKALGYNHAGVIKLKNGQTANYGSIRVENGFFVHYTGMGLREVWPNTGETEKSKELQKLDETEMIKRNYIRFTPVSEISEIIS